METQHPCGHANNPTQSVAVLWLLKLILLQCGYQIVADCLIGTAHVQLWTKIRKKQDASLLSQFPHALWTEQCVLIMLLAFLSKFSGCSVIRYMKCHFLLLPVFPADWVTVAQVVEWVGLCSEAWWFGPLALNGNHACVSLPHGSCGYFVVYHHQYLEKRHANPIHHYLWRQMWHTRKRKTDSKLVYWHWKGSQAPISRGFTGI